MSFVSRPDPSDEDSVDNQEKFQEFQSEKSVSARSAEALPTADDPGIFEDLQDPFAFDADWSEEDSQQRPPQIRFLDKSRLAVFAKKRKEKDKESQAKSILAQIEAAGGDKRLLGLLPTAWASRLEECRARFPNFAVLIDFLDDQFALSARGDSRVFWPPILLTGAPGVGKTAVARWLADQLGLPFRVFDMASAQSSSALAGSDIFWSNSQPGHLFELLTGERWANPVIVLDELDKVSGDSRFNPMSSLYTLLERESARVFKDLSVPEFGIDASHVNWMATANDESQIPAPILSRMTVLHIDPPTSGQMRGIAQSVYEGLLKEASWGPFFDKQLDDAVLDALVGHSPRILKLMLQRALGSAAKAGRAGILAEDVPTEAAPCKKWAMGFLDRNI
ncbi:AAA family ATPase [Acidithiobacillus sp. MC6.1]|nr:AAA family ATPase [Acidithiobacillus sp. MC6.1]